MESSQEDEVGTERLCLVCGFPGAKFHYGAVSCGGCRAFFRRAVRLNYRPKCKTRTGKCPIISENRKKCRKCRLEKCLGIGMKADEVQKDRDPISSARQVSSDKFQEELRNVSLYRSNAATLQHFDAATLHRSDDASCSFDANVTSSSSSSSSADALTVASFLGIPMEPQKPVLALLTVPTMSIGVPDLEDLMQKALCFEATLFQLSKAGLYRYWKRRGLSSNWDLRNANPSTLPSVTKLASADVNELLCVWARSLIDTAKMDTDFCSLPVRDQATLIRSSSFITTFMSGVRRSRIFEGVYVTVDEQHAIRFTEVGQQTAFVRAVDAFRCTQPDEVEFALLKLIAFWNAENCGKQSRFLVQQNRERCFAALEHYVMSKANRVPGTLGRITLLLCYLQKFSDEARLDSRTKFREPDALVQDVFLTDVEG